MRQCPMQTVNRTGDLGNNKATFGALITVVGLAALWRFFGFATYRAIHSLCGTSLFTPEMMYCCVLVLICITSPLIAWRQSTRNPHAASNIRAYYFIGFAPPIAVCICALLGIASSPPLLVDVFSICSALLFSASTSFFLVEWTRLLAARPSNHTRSIIISVIASSALNYFIISFDEALYGQHYLLSIICAPITALCLWKLRRDGESKTLSPAQSLSNPGRNNSSGPTSTEPSLLRRALLIETAALFFLSLSVSGSVNDAQLNPALLENQVLRHLVTLAEILLFLAYTSVCNSTKKLTQLAWISFAVLFLAGLVLVRMSAIPAVQFGVALISAGGRCFELLLFVLVIAYIRIQHGRPDAAIALFVIPEAIAGIMSRALLPSLYEQMGWVFHDYINLLSLVLIIAFIVCMFVFLLIELFKNSNYQPYDYADPSESSVLIGPTVEGSLLTGKPKSSPDSFDSFVTRYSLSERETDVARLVTKGYSADRIAEIMGLSVNTVRTHTKNLYRKLAIHSRQDLIDLAERSAP